MESSGAVCLHQYGVAAGDADEVRVAGPVGAGKEDVVPFIEQDHERIGKGLLAARGQDDVFRLGFYAVLALEIAADGLTQFKDAVHRSVLGEIRINGFFRRFADMGRGGSIGFTHGKADDLNALRFQFQGLGIDGKGGGRSKELHSFGKFHGCISC